MPTRRIAIVRSRVVIEREPSGVVFGSVRPTLSVRVAG